MGHIARQCPPHLWNQPSGSRARATHDYYEQEEPIQVARTIAARTLGDRANKYLQKTTTRSRTNLLESSDLERILEVPEPDGLGEGFTL